MDGWENTVEIRDPSKINIQDATKLYDHWRTRQKQKRSPVFKFVKALDSRVIHSRHFGLILGLISS